MTTAEYEESGPPSDRERTDEWRRTLYSKLDAVHAAINQFKMALYILIALGVVGLWKAW